MNPMRNRRIAKYPSSVHYGMPQMPKSLSRSTRVRWKLTSPSSTGDIALTPAWLQWLRHTRSSPPTIEEQHAELQRQANVKQLAAQADQRWREQESFLDSPAQYGQPTPLMEPRDRGGHVPQTEPDANQGVRNMAAFPDEVAGKARGEDVDKGRFKGETREEPREDQSSPWDRYKQQKGPSEGWQPENWTPGKVEPR